MNCPKVARVELEEELVATEKWRAQILLEQVETPCYQNFLRSLIPHVITDVGGLRIHNWLLVSRRVKGQDQGHGQDRIHGQDPARRLSRLQWQWWDAFKQEYLF